MFMDIEILGVILIYDFIIVVLSFSYILLLINIKILNYYLVVYKI